MEKFAAVIGTRNPGPYQKRVCRRLTRILLDAGYIIDTGAADGCDEIAMSEAGNQCDVYLPWTSYNAHHVSHHKPRRVIVYDPKRHIDWTESVRKYHPNPKVLTRGPFALHARNFGIVKPVSVVVALPSASGGGTMQGVRIARALYIPSILYYESYSMAGVDLAERNLLKIINEGR